MIPLIRNAQTRRINIPEFSGGVNFRDGASEMLDNQLLECKNVWYKNGVLQTRPAFKTLPLYFFQRYGYEIGESMGADHFKTRVFVDENHVKVINGKAYFLVAVQDPLRTRIFYCNEDMETSPHQHAIIEDNLYEDALFFHYGDDVYLISSSVVPDPVYPIMTELYWVVYKISDNGGKIKVTKITEETSEEDGGFYIPTVMINCLPTDKQSLYTYSDEPIVEGTQFEGFNILGNKYKLMYTTVNRGLLEGINAKQTHKASYELLYNVEQNKSVTVDVTWAAKNAEKKIGTYRHIVNADFSPADQWNYESWTSDNRPPDNVYLGVCGRTIAFFSCDDEKMVELSLEDYMGINNMEVVASYALNSDDRVRQLCKVVRMTKAIWYGGHSEGLNGGLHLFLCGNLQEDEKSLVVWSDVNKPLYFSENCYTYVGDKAQKAVAFGKQGENLVVFKERELFATKYTSNNSITAEAIINQSVVDIAANESVFPMIQVHGYIGCDCPETIELCRDRLVWANSDGKVYTLTNLSQYNERSVYEVSGMINKELSKYSLEDFKKSTAADWNGHYVLSIGDKMYLMDYNSYGYAHVYYYAKNEDAQKNIPWWVWQKPKYKGDTEQTVNIVKMVSLGNQLYLLAKNFIGEIPETAYLNASLFAPEMIVMDENSIVDVATNYEISTEQNALVTTYLNEQGINTEFQTKLFDFGVAANLKSIPKAEISLGANDGVPISVTTITNNGNSAEEIFIDGENLNKNSAEFLEEVVLRNSEKLCNRIGYRFESDGKIYLNSMAIYYKFLRGAK